jgi:hypothetical protein
MNRKKSKRIKAQSATIIVDWFASLLDKEESSKINVKNYMSFMPDQTHFMAGRTMYLNAYHPKWVIKTIKQLLRDSPNLSIETITLEDIQWKRN